MRWWGLLVFFLLLAACERQAPRPGTLEEAGVVVPPNESWETEFYLGEGGNPRAIMLAGYMADYTEGDSTYMLLQGEKDETKPQVTIFLFDVEGDTSATLTADRVYYYERDRLFNARGDVMVVGREGKRLATEDLTWHEFERTVETEGFVRITDVGEEIQGYDLVADEDLATYTLQRVTATFEVEDDS